MKKYLVTVLFLCAAAYCNGQNYECLQNNVTRYFINSNGYLRGIRIDSGVIKTDTTVYYPFHTYRGAYDTLFRTKTVFDPNGGSWLGKRVRALKDGTFIFDNYWSDSTVVIKTKANAGDEWTFYKDTGTLYYKATVTGTDTMTVAGAPDSVKKIVISAQNASGPVTTDPLNGYTIWLSKNSGLVQTFDLFTFPYHKPDSAYRHGLDFWLDASMCNADEINSLGTVWPNMQRMEFRLTAFINPNEQQLYDPEPGDIILSTTITGLPMPVGSSARTDLRETVISKTVSGHLATVTASGTEYSCPYAYPCSLICGPGIRSYSDIIHPVMDTLAIQEDAANTSNYIFYYPDDTSYCMSSPAYACITPVNTHGLGEVVRRVKYKLGLGKTYFFYEDGEPTYETDQLDAYYKQSSGAVCGPLAEKDVVAGQNTISVYPDPAGDELNIKTDHPIDQLCIYDAVGRQVYNYTSHAKSIRVNISGLAQGIYFLKINGADVRRFMKQ